MEREQYEMFAALTETLNENANLVIDHLGRVEAMLVKLDKVLSKGFHEQDGPVSGRSEGFEEFWKAYPKGPRKVGKSKALGLWKMYQIAPAHVDNVMKALAFDKASEQWTRHEGQYIPLVCTWLSRKRWLDDLSDARPRPTVLNELDAITAQFGGGDSPRNGVPSAPPRG